MMAEMEHAIKPQGAGPQGRISETKVCKQAISLSEIARPQGS